MIKHAKSRCLRAWLRPGPETCCWGRGLSERSEFRSPSKRDRGKGTPWGHDLARMVLGPFAETKEPVLSSAKEPRRAGGETPPTSGFRLLHEQVETLEAQRFIDL